MTNPEKFASTDAYRRYRERSSSHQSAPSHLAFVLPTTQLTWEAAVSSCAKDDAIVGGAPLTGALTPSLALKRLREGQSRPLLLIFSDQILSSADATIRVRTDSTDRYLSPLEFILNTKYGYELVVWTKDGFTTTVPAGSDEKCIFMGLNRYLDTCESLSGDWQVRELQSLRTPEVRKYNASRKLRFFRSAIVNAYRDEARNAGASVLLDRVSNLEARYLAGVEA